MASLLDYLPSDAYAGALSRLEVEALLGPLKEILTAGSATSFTYSEWKNLLDTILALAPQLTRIPAAFTADQKSTLVEIIAGTVEELRPIAARHGSNISMSAVDRLIQNVPDRLLPLAKNDLLKLVPLAKQLFVAGSDRRISPQEWSALLTIVVESSDPALT